jgi:NADPH:quinone reductase-like Zn-dependent oxidoreductase
MKAIVFEEYGSVEALKIRELPEPALKKGEALVRIKTIGLNPRDTAIREGKLKFLTGRSFPKLTGADFSGGCTPGGDMCILPPKRCYAKMAVSSA